MPLPQACPLHPLRDGGRGAVVGLRHGVGARLVFRCLCLRRSRCILCDGGHGALFGLRHGVGAGIVFRCLHISRSHRIVPGSGRGAVVCPRHNVGARLVFRYLHVSRSRCIVLGSGRGAVFDLRHAVGAGIVFRCPCLRRSRCILCDGGRGAVVGLRHSVGAGRVIRCPCLRRSRCILSGGGRGAVVGLRHSVGACSAFRCPLFRRRRHVLRGTGLGAVISRRGSVGTGGVSRRFDRRRGVIRCSCRHILIGRGVGGRLNGVDTSWLARRCRSLPGRVFLPRDGIHVATRRVSRCRRRLIRLDVGGPGRLLGRGRSSPGRFLVLLRASTDVAAGNVGRYRRRFRHLFGRWRSRGGRARIGRPRERLAARRDAVRGVVGRAVGNVDGLPRRSVRLRPTRQEHAKQDADDHDGRAGRGRDAERLAPLQHVGHAAGEISGLAHWIRLANMGGATIHESAEARQHARLADNSYQSLPDENAGGGDGAVLTGLRIAGSALR